METQKTIAFVGAILFVLGVIGILLVMTRPTSPPTSTSSEIRHTAYTTAYTYYDNTPPGSAAIAFAKSYGYPTLHEVASGTGTWEDPITLAVGHVITTTGTTTVDTPDFAPGTRFYLPNVKKYFIVEDTCGDGPTPQDKPCHKLTPEVEATGAEIWVDLWIDGAGGSQEVVTACASELTDGMGKTHILIENPRPDYVVIPGRLFENGRCAQQFGDTLEVI